MQLSNPYGAVANALKDTRLTLRDIGQDLAAEQHAANQMNLAVSEQDIRRAKTMSDIETEKQRRAETAARLYGQNLQNQQLAQIIKDQNTVVTAEDFANRYGAKHILPLFGIDPKEKRPAAQWAPIGQQIAGVMQKSPFIAFQATQFDLQGQINELNDKIAQPGLDETTKGKLVQQLKSKTTQYTRNSRLFNNITEPSATELGREWDKDPDLQAAYPDKQKYISATQEAHRALRADEKNMQMRLATVDIDPNYTQTMRAAQQVIASKITDRKAAEKILNNIDALIAKNDYQAAYNLAKSWAEKLGAPAAANTPGIPNMPPPSQPQTAGPQNQPQTIDTSDIPSAGMARMKKIGNTAVSLSKAAWANTGGKIGNAMTRRAEEQTATAQKEIAALKEKNKLTPAALDDIKRKYPYADIK